MTEFIEIAYAAATKRLCLFTGTGFSRAISNENAPSWQSLLEKLCDLLPDADELKADLFPVSKARALNLEESAQIISIKLQRQDKNIYDETAKIISHLQLGDNIDSVKKFFEENSFRVITTNYDKLAELLAGINRVQSITPGLPIPKKSADVKVYHVHGSIDAPMNMVITSEDYFRFINGDSYFSKKLSTSLHENTIVILGYSLGDTNLKAIINDYKIFSKNNSIGSNIFLVSMDPVSNDIKDYYFYCFGIRVIDGMGINSFFRMLNDKLPSARNVYEISLKSIREVILEGKVYTKEYLKMEDSFYQIISSIAAEGYGWNDERIINLLRKILDSKMEFTYSYNAWDQYEHLAKWLIYLGSVFEITSSKLEEKYLEAVTLSMNKMSEEKRTGYSWYAYRAWQTQFTSIIASNRTLIKKHIEKHSTHKDALTLVKGFN